MKKITLSLLLVSGLWACSESPQTGTNARAEERPNIIYVLADDLGYGDVGVYNSESKIATPYLDQLASEGMIFTDAHTTSSVCTPTRYGILTGRYNWRSPLKHSVLNGRSKSLIPADRATVASVLQQQGYHAAFIGKWHLGWDWAVYDTAQIDTRGRPKNLEGIDYTQPLMHGPNDLGFDYVYGHAASLNMPPYLYLENGQVTMLPDTISEGEIGTGWPRGLASKDFKHEQVTPHFFQQAYHYISEQAKSDTPFFLYFALPSPHTPILPTEPWRGKSQLNDYGDFVMMVDDYMGKLLEAVEKAGIAENTLIIFTSDNGCAPAADIEGMKAKGHYPNYVYRGMKADIYEGGHRVPFIVRWPAQIKPKQLNDRPICTTDFMATAAEICGYALADDEGEDSFSMLPLFKGNSHIFKRKSMIHQSVDGSFAIRRGDWKLSMCRGSAGWSEPNRKTKGYKSLPELQLYNLKQDPGETTNLYLQYPELTRELIDAFFVILDNGRSTAGEKQANDPPYHWYKSWHQVVRLEKYSVQNAGI